jgi:hypothetical protein
MNYKTIDDSPINLSDFELSSETLLKAIELTNQKFEILSNKTKEMHLDVFDVIDFRVLSGMVGETLVGEIAAQTDSLKKNPNLDGYPDLVQTSTSEMKKYFEECHESDFIKYKFGGIEVKNTFGTKKSGSFIIQGDSRIEQINKKLDWKAHHQFTNNLLAIFSDYYNGLPRISAVCYNDNLTESDWSAVQRPKAGSAMTSFSCITSEGYKKIKNAVKICNNDKRYLNFFNL